VAIVDWLLSLGLVENFRANDPHVRRGFDADPRVAVREEGDNYVAIRSKDGDGLLFASVQNEHGQDSFVRDGVLTV
jgi:hypothetical protein